MSYEEKIRWSDDTETAGRTNRNTQVRVLIDNPLIGEQKKGDLSFMRVYKFNMVKQLTFLGYSYENDTVILELIALGTHENFYRDVKTLF